MNTSSSIITKRPYTKPTIIIPNQIPSKPLVKRIEVLPEGWYIVSDCGEFSNDPWSPYLFPIVDVNYCTSMIYKNNIYVGQGITGTYKGSWHQIQLFTPMIFKKVTITNRLNQGVNNFIIFGSNNNSNWNIIYTGTMGTTSTYQLFILNNTVAYTYYRIVVLSSQDTYFGYMCFNYLKWETV